MFPLPGRCAGLLSGLGADVAMDERVFPLPGRCAETIRRGSAGLRLGFGPERPAAMPVTRGQDRIPRAADQAEIAHVGALRAGDVHRDGRAAAALHPPPRTRPPPPHPCRRAPAAPAPRAPLRPMSCTNPSLLHLARQARAGGDRAGTLKQHYGSECRTQRARPTEVLPNWIAAAEAGGGQEENTARVLAEPDHAEPEDAAPGEPSSR